MMARPIVSASRALLKVGAIVLAAGRSSRMAPRNKLLELVDSRPIVAHVAAVALASGADPVIVVTGFEASRIEDALRDLNVTIVRNPDFEGGLSTSLRTGLGALPPGSDGALILLGDMPAVDGSVLGDLTAAFTSRDAICVPVHRGQRGNPVLWGRNHFPEMMELVGDVGAKQLAAIHRDRVTEVTVASNGILSDVDTPSELAHLRRRLGSNRS
jgi:molybdenum cofactor cytidylyltransferase